MSTLRAQATKVLAFLVAAAVVGAGMLAAAGAGAAEEKQAQAKLPGSDIIPADRLADWRPGVAVGVPGGIPKDRTKLLDVTKAPYSADATGAADAQPAIQKAIADAKDGEVVYLPAGTYRVDHGISVAGGKSRITIRGDGPEKTVLMGYQPSGSIIGITPADGGDWWYEGRLKFDVTGSPQRGATVLTVGDTKPLDGYPNGGIGQLVQISLKNDPKVPVVAPAKFDYMRRQISRIVAKTAATVTISPGLLFDLPADLVPVLRPGGRYAEAVGIEDLAVDGTHTTSPHGLVGINQGFGCWAKNVKATNAQSYIFTVDGSLQCEVRHCRIEGRKSAAGPNGGGLLCGLAAFCLFEDNIFSPSTEVNSSSGNVLAYNFVDDVNVQGDLLASTMNANHGAHGSFNLYEGNKAPRFQSDGYHGSASHDTAFRNWFHGSSTKTTQYWICVNLNRFSRCYNVVGNVLGRKGATWLYEVEPTGFSYEKHFVFSLGYPNMGNGWANGKTAQPSKGLYWADWEKYLAAPRGKGPGPGGFQELDLDVKATTLLRGNYNYKDAGVPESESLDKAVLPKSLYLSEKPAWFGDLAWPPFGPDTEFERNKIPAEVRYEAMHKGAGAAGK